MIALYKWLLSLFTKNKNGCNNKDLFDYYYNEMRKGTKFYSNRIKRKFVITAIDSDEYLDCVRVDVRLSGDTAIYCATLKIEKFHKEFKPVIRLKANLKD